MKDGRTGKTKPMPQRPNQMSPNGGSVLGDERTGYRSGDRSLRAGGAKSPIPIDLERGFLCDLCGVPMQERHCKLLCLCCGYQRDCSDP